MRDDADPDRSLGPVRAWKPVSELVPVLTGPCVCRMKTVSQALEELLVAAQRQDCLTLGVYESAKLMNV